MPTKRKTPPVRNTSLQDAVETGDLPTAHLWLKIATANPFERGVALLEALADPLFEGEERQRIASSFLDSLEDWLALEEPAAQILLYSAIARAATFEAMGTRLLAVGKLVEVATPSADALALYAQTRAMLLARPPRVAGQVWRLDQGSSFVPTGKDVVVTLRAAAALAEVRRMAAELCGLVSEHAVAPFEVGETDAPARIVCAANVLGMIRAHLTNLQSTASESALLLKPGAKK